jgi:hypothetical protein
MNVELEKKQKEKAMKIQEALGVEILSEEARVKLMKDHLVLERAQNLMFEFFAPTAISLMHPVEKAALLKRIGPPPAPRVTWTVGTAQRSLRPLLIAKFRTEELYFDGPPENAPLVEFHGENPPVYILQKYAGLYDPNNKPQLDASYWIARTSKVPAPQF